MGCNSLFGVETHTYVQEKNRENFSSINDGHFGKKNSIASFQVSL